MAKVLLTLAHPNPDSLNGAIFQRLETTLKDLGHEVRTKDLYAEDFQPVLGMKDFMSWGSGELLDDVKAEQEHITWADALAYVYPIWWNERPAMLKGYFDRVLTKGYAWDFSDTGREGLLAGKRGFVVNTYGSPVPLYDQDLGISRPHLPSSMEKGTLNFCGVSEVEVVSDFGILMRDRAANEKFVDDVEARARAFFG